jgi:probable rRNA maturation factor
MSARQKQAPRRAAPARRRRKLEIDLAFEAAAWRRALPRAAQLVVAAAEGALAQSGKRAAVMELSVVLGDDRLVRGLNRRWRGKDAPTNVLSFASAEPARAGRPLLLGDVVLAYETVAREAEEQGKPLADHLRHLVTHGVLHLLGFDHAAEAEAQRMEALERRVLAKLGVPDPYELREAADG